MKQIEFELNVGEIDQLIECFSQIAKKSGHKIGFEVNSNLSKLKSIRKDVLKTIDEFRESKHEKDADENVILYETLNGRFKRDENGNLIRYVPPKELKDGEHYSPRFNPAEIDEINKDLKKFFEETHVLNLYLISDDQLKRAFENGSIDGIDCSSIFENGLIAYSE